jgi:hypothetical protein
MLKTYPQPCREVSENGDESYVPSLAKALPVQLTKLDGQFSTRPLQSLRVSDQLHARLW